jgi:hypothetical protein
MSKTEALTALHLPPHSRASTRRSRVRTVLSRVARFAVLFPIALLMGCSAHETTDYAPRYVAALERYPGVPIADTAPIDRFLEFFASSGSSAEADARRVYAETLYFSDTLLTSEDHERVVKHMARMHSATGTLSVEPLGRVISGADVYLIWRMRATFKPLFSEINSDTLGISHLRFDAEGRVVLHQDFWDGAAGFYQHIPLLGDAIRAVGGRFSEPEH